MLRYIYDILRRIRYPFLKYKKVKINYSSSVSSDVYFEGNNKIGKKSIFRKSRIGFGTYFGDNCIVSECEIGRYCSIAYGFKVLIGKHPRETIVSTHPAFFSTKKQAGFSYVNNTIYDEIDYVNKEKKIAVSIGSDVWIGTDVKINNGVTVGDGAVIGAGSLVLHDIKPYEIVAGIPAKKIGERFTTEEQKILLKFKWWNMEEKWLKNNVILFSDIEKMKEWLKNNEI